MKRVIALVLIFCLFCVGVSAKTVSSECSTDDLNVPIAVSSTNATIGTQLEIKAKSSILMEVNTGKILYEDNSDEKLPPASITKIMTLLLVMEAIDKGSINLETVVTASAYACSMGGSQIWLKEGETMTVHELLKATVIASANDASVALGELIAGSEEGFVALMNEKAKELGMNNTTFKNCTGLDAEGHLTTAHDVAVMSKELIKHDLIKNYSTVWMDSLRDGESELVNTNKLVRFYKGTTGLKTGTTSIAKYCLSATAERDGLELVAVVLAGDTSNDRFEGAKKLLDYGFANYSFMSAASELKEKGVAVSKGVKKTVKVATYQKVNILMSKTQKNDIKRECVWNDNLTAPINKGDVVGYVNILLGEENVGKIEIVAAESVEKLNILVTFTQILKGIFKN